MWRSQSVHQQYLHTGGQLNADGCRFGGEIVGVSLGINTLRGQCGHHHTAGPQQLKKTNIERKIESLRVPTSECLEYCIL